MAGARVTLPVDMRRRVSVPKTIALVMALVISLVLSVLVLVGSSQVASAQECAEGTVPSGDGVTCVAATTTTCPAGQELDAAGLVCVDIDTTPPGSPCGAGQELDAAGLVCVDIADTTSPGSPCGAGQQLDAAGLVCVDIDSDGGGTVDGASSGGGSGSPCDAGYSLGRDGETCIADGPDCARGEVLDDAGRCVETFQCPAGQILASDLLSCRSDNCPDGELLSVDGKRCVAAGSECPDGSPRPIGGACLVVETIEGPDGSVEVVVRCAAADTFCQARVKQCAEDRAAGAADEVACADPRGSCDPADEACAASNDRLVECATRNQAADSESGDEGGAAVRIGGANDPCTDLCPELHRLDPSGECVEYLDPRHPCVAAGAVPRGVTTNAVLDSYSYLAGLGTCVTRSEFLRRLGNFEAAAGAEADALSLLRETTSSYLTIEGQLAELDQLLINAERDVRRFTAAAAEADLDRANNAKLLLYTRKQLAREEVVLRDEVLHVFVIGGSDALIEKAILSATNVTEISVAQLYGEVLLDDQVANIARVEALDMQVQQFSVALDRAANEVEASLAAAVDSAASLETLRDEAQALREEQLERRQIEAELVAELRSDTAAFAQDLGIFEQDTLEINAIIEQEEFRVTAFTSFDGILANPIFPRTVITSGFGPRLHPILGYVRNHNGVDITAGFGEEILATADGVVQIAQGFGGYGNTVVIDHGGDLLTLSAHMSAIFVGPGEEVFRGDTIGLVGSTGLSTGPHLHFEVWEDRDRAVDPTPYLTDAE